MFAVNAASYSHASVRLTPAPETRSLKEGTPPSPYGSLDAAKEAGAVTLNYGQFINTIISFLIVAFSVFMIVRSINKAKKEEEAAPPPPTKKNCPLCCSEIAIEAKRCAFCTAELPAESG